MGIMCGRAWRTLRRMSVYFRCKDWNESEGFVDREEISAPPSYYSTIPPYNPISSPPLDSRDESSDFPTYNRTSRPPMYIRDELSDIPPYSACSRPPPVSQEIEVSTMRDSLPTDQLSSQQTTQNSLVALRGALGEIIQPRLGYQAELRQEELRQGESRQEELRQEELRQGARCSEGYIQIDNETLPPPPYPAPPSYTDNATLPSCTNPPEALPAYERNEA